MPQQEQHPDFPGFDEIKSLADSETPYVFAVSLPEVAGHFRMLKMGGIAVSDGWMQLKDQFTGQVSMKHFNDLPLVEMNFSLEGCIRQRLGFLKEEVLFTRGYHNIMYNQGEWEHNHFLNGGTHNTFTINIHAGRFMELFAAYSAPMDQLANSVLQQRPFLLQQPAIPYTPQMLSIIRSFWDGTFTGSLKQLFMEAKMMELLLLQFELFAQPMRGKAAGPDRDELDKLHLAREILLKDVQHPPTLAQLAKQCGLNEFKLKKGFKAAFNNTVFGYFAAARLEQARQLVLHTGKTISEIAYETGFSHPQHFQRAFKKHFGTPPGQLRK
jgi:AraC-like DNA-binding protein